MAGREKGFRYEILRVCVAAYFSNKINFYLRKRTEMSRKESMIDRNKMCLFLF